MTGQLCIIWDYDTPLGQLNASYPYKFDVNHMVKEIDDVQTILELGVQYQAKMTFAVVGFAAESSFPPFDLRHQIQEIHAQGHEIASHSWRHEWFPSLDAKQASLSLKRSKEALEACIGVKDSVKGFVPPFSRPMSWYKRAAWSLGDKSPRFWSPVADLGGLSRLSREAGYEWIRVTYRPLYWKLLERFGMKEKPRPWFHENNFSYVPYHHNGFDTGALKLLKWAIETNNSLVLVGHPQGLRFPHAENLNHLKTLLEIASKAVQLKELSIITISEQIALQGV